MRSLQLTMIVLGAAVLTLCAYVLERLPTVLGLSLTVLSVLVALMLTVSASALGRAPVRAERKLRPPDPRRKR